MNRAAYGPNEDLFITGFPGSQAGHQSPSSTAQTAKTLTIRSSVRTSKSTARGETNKIRDDPDLSSPLDEGFHLSNASILSAANRIRLRSLALIHSVANSFFAVGFHTTVNFMTFP